YNKKGSWSVQEPEGRTVYRWLLHAEGAAAATRALHVRIVELEARALERFHVIDFDAIQIHRAHLVNRHLQSVEIRHFIRFVCLVLKCHVVLKTRAASAHYRNAQRRGSGILHAHDFLHLRSRNWRQVNHKSNGPHRGPCRENLYKTSIT